MNGSIRVITLNAVTEKIKNEVQASEWIIPHGYRQELIGTSFGRVFYGTTLNIANFGFGSR